MKYVILHGTFGHPNENWFPRLKQHLEEQGHQVWIPHLPTPEQQTPEIRCKELQKQVPFTFGNDTILIGHSLGATYILDILDREREEPIKKAILISGFLNVLGNETFDSLNIPFLKPQYNWEYIRENAEEIIILHGDNDPYVPLSEAHLLKNHTGGVLEIIPN
ncbi:MAG: alpha/beta hydrolase [Candidatus Peribacteria bacterium]|jgi:predicted alpha/beta hydrolase family esterase|nr:alpha/beta hydrolase [Candidatus Peribacteria bacterium]